MIPQFLICRRRLFQPIMLALVLANPTSQLMGQAYGEPDRGKPGDQMIQSYLAQEARNMEADFLGDIKTSEQWQNARPEYRREYYEMLGLWPVPEKTPLKATVTRTLDRGDYLVDMLHYQSKPGLYVTANVYRPAKVENGQRLPAILYVCGHSGRGRNGNKTAFQSHGIWFARHGYICLMVDTLQLGEIAGIHHGTYREGRWWWLSRGYTPAGVECWNGVRGIDYLISRPDVDPERIGVTGISGGGAATFWISAADERVKVAVPVSGMADLVSYLPNRVINGHCDCMFLYNAHQWHWTRIAGMIAPRPMLFVNSDKDPIFPMDANDRVINNLERLYSLFGAGDLVDAFVSVGGHDYRKDIRQGVYRFMNAHLKGDPRPITDSEVDLVTDGREPKHPIAPEQLRVFAQDSDIPSDARNALIDKDFVPVANIELPQTGDFEKWKANRLASLRRLTFQHFPERIPAATEARDKAISSEEIRLETEPGIQITIQAMKTPPDPARTVLAVWTSDTDEIKSPSAHDEALYVCKPRGVGPTEWTRKNPPNFVERSHYLLGRTVDSGRVWDIVATARYLKERSPSTRLVIAAGNSGAALAVYAALLEPGIDELFLRELPGSHMNPEAPALLNVLRTCDIGEALGMLAPRPVTVFSGNAASLAKAAQIYERAGARKMLNLPPGATDQSQSPRGPAPKEP